MERRKYAKMFFLCSYVSEIWRCVGYISTVYVYRVVPKNWHHFIHFIFINIDQFLNIIQFRYQEKICNNTFTKNPITPEVCHYTTLRRVCVLKAPVENKTTSVNFKKTTCLLTQLLPKVTFIPCSDVHCVRLAAGRRIQAGDDTDK